MIISEPLHGFGEYMYPFSVPVTSVVLITNAGFVSLNVNLVLCYCPMCMHYTPILFFIE